MSKATGYTLPFLVVIIVFDYFQPRLSGIAKAFIASPVIFILWENIGIAEENDGAKALIDKAFNYC